MRYACRKGYHDRCNGGWCDCPCHDEEESMERLYVPEHAAQPASKVRDVIGVVLDRLGLWRWLPGRIQGALCGCPTCRGEVTPPA